MARVISARRDDLLGRREAIVRDRGIDLADLVQKARTHTLSADERDALDELEEISFLLGERPET